MNVNAKCKPTSGFFLSVNKLFIASLMFVTRISLAVFIKVVSMGIILSLAYILVYNVHLYVSSASLSCGTLRLWDIWPLLMHIIPGKPLVPSSMPPIETFANSEQHRSQSWVVATTAATAFKYLGARQIGPAGVVVAICSYLWTGPFQ